MGRLRVRQCGSGDRRGIWGILVVLLLSACSSTPPWAGLEAAPLFEFGAQAFEEGEYDDAIAALERYIASFPGAANVAEARMLLGRSHFAKREYITAAAEFERFLLRHPSHGLAPEASLGICRAYAEVSPHPQRDQEYTRRAIEACRNTANEFTGMNVAQEARALQAQMFEKLAQRLYEEGRFYQRRGFHDPAILYFRELIDFYPQTSWAPEGFLALYRSYREIGWEEEADEVRRRLLANYPDSDAARALVDGGGDGDPSPEGT